MISTGLSGMLKRRSAVSQALLRCSKSVGRPIAVSQRRSLSAAADVAGLRDILKVSEEVADAIATDKPVVALESTIYTHGALGNDLAQKHSDLVRSHGGVPAIIAIVDGVPKVGTSTEDIIRMIEDEKTVKASRRDIAYLVGMVWPHVSS